VRFQKDKGNGAVDFLWCHKFNNWIDKNCLLEINLVGRNFTWSNNQENPIFSHIYRIFCSTDFDGKFPLAIAKALPRNPSDHVPILWDSGQGLVQKKPRFKFENWWVRHEDFRGVKSRVLKFREILL
jgi:hypothetical protein